jgi:hypothetical protein
MRPWHGAHVACASWGVAGYEGACNVDKMVQSLLTYVVFIHFANSILPPPRHVSCLRMLAAAQTASCLGADASTAQHTLDPAALFA